MIKRKLKNQKKIKVTDLGIPEDFRLDKEGLTQSLMNTFFSCRRKFVITLNKWEPLAKMNVFDFGNFVHEVKDQTIKEKRFLENREIVDIIENYCNKKFLMGEKVSENKVKALSTMLVYSTVYDDDFKTFDFKYSEKEVSRIYKGILLKGKIDGCYTLENGKKLCLMEHKTKGSMDDFKQTLTYDFQTQFYPFISGEKVDEILYNIIKKPQQRCGKKESLIDFKTRLDRVILEKKEEFFERYIIKLDAESKEVFKKELDEKLSIIGDFVNNKRLAIPIQSACRTGFIKCPYIDMCSRNEVDLNAYKQRTKISPELETI
jgi:PD-(D/E)XK nuclease superfamily